MSSPKQRILVTGGNSGVGYESVKQLSLQQPDSTILLGTRSLVNGQTAIQRMREQAGSAHRFDNVTPLVLDVADQSSIERAVAQVQAEHGRLNTLVHNAGTSNLALVQYANGRVPSTREVMAVNVHGVRHTTDAFLPLMPPHDSHVIVVSSEVGSWITARLPPPLQAALLSPSLDWPTLEALARDWEAALDGQPSGAHEWPPAVDSANAYGASKALVSAYTRVLAREQAGQRAVVAVTPGLCSTALSGFTGRSVEAGAASVVWPIGRWEQVEQGVFYRDGAQLSYCHAMPPAK